MTTSPIHLFKQTVSIQRSDSTVANDGSVSQSWTTEYANVKASVQPLAARNTDRSVLDVQPARFNVFLAGDLTIQKTDRVLFEDRTLRVLDIRNLSHVDRVIQLTAEEVLV